MKDNQFNRRKLLGIALATTSTVALAESPFSVFSFLQSSEGEAKVKAIVVKYFERAKGSDAVLGAFYRSLLAGTQHHENKAFFLEHLEKKELEVRLETYVIEEFVLSTNYLHVVAGEEPALRMRLA